MSMIGEFVDISLERVDAVNRSHQPPAESKKRVAPDISGQAPFDVVQQLVLVALELAARLVERPPRFVSPALQRLDLTLEPKLLGEAGRKSGGLLRLLDAHVKIVQRSFQTVAPVPGPTFELLDLQVEPSTVPGIELLEKRPFGIGEAGRQILSDRRVVDAASHCSGKVEQAAALIGVE